MLRYLCVFALFVLHSALAANGPASDPGATTVPATDAAALDARSEIKALAASVAEERSVAAAEAQTQADAAEVETYERLRAAIRTDSPVEDYQALWQAYLSSKAYIQAHTVAEIPYLKNLDQTHDAAGCTSVMPEVQSALRQHFPNLALHYVALRCATILGNSEQANQHEAYFTHLSEVMTAGGDGSDHQHPLWAGSIADANSFVQVSGYTPIDGVFFRAGEDKAFFYYLQAIDEDAQSHDFIFAAEDLINSLVQAHTQQAVGDNPIARRAWDKALGQLLAIRWLAEQGVNAARVLMGDILASYNNQATFSLVLDYYQTAAEQGSAIAANRYAKQVLRQQLKDRYESAVDYLSAAVDKRDCYSTTTLLQMYEKSLGAQRDPEIISALVDLCGRDSSRAEYLDQVARAFAEARGAHYDLDLALNYWEQAAQLGYSPSRIKLAMAYVDGKGREKDAALGMRILSELVAQDDTDAMVTYGYYLSHLPEFREQYGSPVVPALKSAEAGNSTAMHNLGYYYREGIGTERNLAESHRWYVKAAEHEYEDSYYFLGVQFLLGLEGVIEPDYAQARHYLELASEGGDNNAMLSLGYMAERGLGMEADLAQAKAWYSKAAAKGNRLAEANLYNAGFRRSGPYLYRYSGESLAQIQELADADDPEALTTLGLLHFHGWLATSNTQLARRLFKKAISQEYPPAHYLYSDGSANFGAILSGWRLSSSDRSNLRFAADHGIGAAAYSLANFYHHRARDDDDDDWEEAFKLYLQAAQSGHTRSKFVVGDFYERGRGTKPNMQQAVAWYKQAATDNYSPALNALGTIYISHQYPGKTETEAVEYLQRAADQGLPLALRNLGRIYARGKYASRDLEKAVDFYLQAVEQDDYDSFIELGELFVSEDELGPNYNIANVYFAAAVKQKPKEGLFWIARTTELMLAAGDTETELTAKEVYELYRAAALQRNSWAKNNLGVMHLRGTAPDADEDDAVEWFEAAHEEGNHSATANLAWCYEHGLGVRQRMNKALELYRAAANRGSPFALVRLAELSEDPASELYDPSAAQSYRELLEPAMRNKILAIAATSMIKLPASAVSSGASQSTSTSADISATDVPPAEEGADANADHVLDSATGIVNTGDSIPR